MQRPYADIKGKLQSKDIEQLLSNLRDNNVAIRNVKGVHEANVTFSGMTLLFQSSH